MMIDKDECWLWAGTQNRFGYGVMPIRGDGADRISNAHRVVYEALIGEIPDGLVLDHLCEVKLCINPKHLEPVTNRENGLRYTRSRTHCKKGHPYADGVKWRTIGGRKFRLCGTCLYIGQQKQNYKRRDGRPPRKFKLAPSPPHNNVIKE